MKVLARACWGDPAGQDELPSFLPVQIPGLLIAAAAFFIHFFGLAFFSERMGLYAILRSQGDKKTLLIAGLDYDSAKEFAESEGILNLRDDMVGPDVYSFLGTTYEIIEQVQ